MFIISEWNEAVISACEQLKNNKVIAVPTDTIYGIAGLAQSNEAVRRIYDIKGRASTKPVAICVGDVQDVGRYVDSCGNLSQSTDVINVNSWLVTDKYMSHFAYACKMRYPLNLVLENIEYLSFY